MQREEGVLQEEGCEGFDEDLVVGPGLVCQLEPSLFRDNRGPGC